MDENHGAVVVTHEMSLLENPVYWPAKDLYILYYLERFFYQDSGSGSIPCGGGVIFPTSTGVDPVSIGFDPSSTWVNPSSTYVYSAYTVVDPNSTGIDPTSTGIHPTSTGVEFPKFPICFSHLCEVKAAKRETYRHTTNVELKKTRESIKFLLVNHPAPFISSSPLHVFFYKTCYFVFIVICTQPSTNKSGTMKVGCNWLPTLSISCPGCTFCSPTVTVSPSHGLAFPLV